MRLEDCRTNSCAFCGGTENLASYFGEDRKAKIVYQVNYCEACSPNRKLWKKESPFSPKDLGAEFLELIA